MGPIVHVALGVTIASMVLVSATVTVVVVASRSQYNSPTLVDDKETTFKTTAKDVFVLKNDVDDKGAILQIVGVTQPPWGKVQIMDNGKFLRYSPMNIGIQGSKYAGDVKFKYQAKNDKLAAWANVTITVLNHAPEPVSLTYRISKNSKDNVAAVLTDKDATGKVAIDLDLDDLFVESTTTPANGKVAISTDKKTILYTPNKDFNRLDSFEYTLTDKNETKTAKITYTVENDAPKARPDFFVRAKNAIATGLTVLDNDSDPNNDVLTIIDVRNSGLGLAFVAPDSLSLIYWPVKGYVGSDSFEYTITDGELTSSSYVSIIIQNQAPTAQSFTITVPKNAVNVPLPIVVGDVDPFETLTITLGNGAEAPQHGVATLNNFPETLTENYLTPDALTTYVKNNYTLSYTPTTGYLGSEVFTYSVSDGKDTTKATITINVVNTAPTAQADVYSVAKNIPTTTTLNVLQNDFDINGDDFHIFSVTAPTNGGTLTIAGTNKQVIYKPATGFVGNETFTYTIRDVQTNPALELTATATVTIIVENQAPITTPDFYTVPRGNIVLLNVLLNDTDTNGDILSVGTIPATSTSGAALAIVGTQVQYTALNAPPYVDTFHYRASDGALESVDTLVTINVVNVAPTANPDIATLKWNSSRIIDVIANDADINPSDTPLLQIHTFNQPANGLVTRSDDKKSFTYTPNTGFVGVDTMTYSAIDSFGAVSAATTVTFTVTNAAPLVSSSTVQQHWGTTKVYGTGATDPDSDPVALISVTGAGSSIVAGQIQFVATTSLGLKPLTFTVTDWNLQSSAILTVNVTNTLPIAGTDTASIHWRSVSGVTINVLTNDIDIDGDSLSVTGIAQAASNGALTVMAGNTQVSYVPSGTFSGTDTGKYTLFDGAESVTGDITVTVTNNNLPTSAPQSFTLHWRTKPTRVEVSTSTTDLDGDSLIPSVTSGPTTGTVNTLVDGTTGITYFSYEQPNQFVGSSSFAYRVTDGLANSAPSTISFTITNTLPVARTYTNIYVPYSVASTAGYSLNVINDATDADVVDVPFLVVSNFTQGAQGTVTLDVTNKIFKYVVNSGMDGDDSFTYTVTDGAGVSMVATISITVGPASLAAVEKSYSVHWRTAQAGVGLDAAFNVTGSDSKSVYLNAFVQPTAAHGTTVFGTPYIKDDVIARVYNMTYTAATGYLGVDTFAIQTRDIPGATGQILVSITITNTVPVCGPITQSRHWRLGALTLDPLATCTDANLDTVTFDSFSAVSPAGCGTVEWNAGPKTGTFTPTLFIGACTFTYTATDGIQFVSRPITITVTNTAPVAINKFGLVHWSQHANGFNISNLSAGDSDVNTDPITITTVSQPTPSSAGTTTRYGATGVTIKALSGSTFVNNNLTFTYTITDTRAIANGLVNLQVYNTVPVASADNYVFNGTVPQTPKTLLVLTNDNDGDRPTFDTVLTIRSITAPTSGTATIRADNQAILYTPAANFVGTVTLTYIATDGFANSAPATVTITINNLAPTAVADLITVQWNGVATRDLIANDFDNDLPTNTPLSLTAITVNPSFGSITLVGNSITYTPFASQTYTSTVGNQRQATDTFQYRVTDSYGRTAIGLVTVQIRNAIPVANNDYVTVAKIATMLPITIPVLSNDTDSDNDNLSIGTISYTTGNGATVNKVGNDIIYTPNNNFRVGTDFFTYSVTDGQLTSNTATVFITVTNSPPTCQAISRNVGKNAELEIDLADFVSDVNGDPLAIALDAANVYTRANVTLVGSLATVISNPRRSGVFTWRYRVSDSLAWSSFCTVTINIVNQAPVAEFDAAGFMKRIGATNIIDVLPNDSDADGDSFIIQSFSDFDNQINNPSIGGALSISPDFKSMIFRPNNTFTSPPTLQFTYTIVDDDIDTPLTATALVNVTIRTNGPRVVDDYITTVFNTYAYIPIATLLANDISPTGVVGTGELVFQSIVPCGALDPLIFCVGGQPIIDPNNPNQIVVPFRTNSCKSTKFQYCIYYAFDPTATQCGTVTLSYTSCQCIVPIDIAFVLDSSGSISNTNWRAMMDIVQEITNRLNLGANAIQAAYVQYSKNVKIVRTLTSVRSECNAAITTLRTTHMASSTNTNGGLIGGRQELLATNRTVNGLPGAKVIMLFTDGVSTTGGNPVPTAQQINSWTMGAVGNPVPSVSWKVVAAGIGSDLYSNNQQGWKQVVAMNYDPARTLAASWNNLGPLVSQVIDATCDV